MTSLRVFAKLTLTICGAVSSIGSINALIVTPSTSCNPAISLFFNSYNFALFSECPVYISFTATPKPAIAGTFSVPERIPSCCPPPKRIGRILTFSFTYKNPLPFGPWILCPLTDIISTPSFLGTILYFPNAWIAST